MAKVRNGTVGSRVRTLLLAGFVTMAAGAARAIIQEATNGFLTVVMEDSPDRMGLFSVKTGDGHIPPNRNVFYGAADPTPAVNTSYITFSDDTGSTMWVNAQMHAPSTPGRAGYGLESMYTQPRTFTSLGTPTPRGFRVAYELPHFRLVQEVAVVGSVLANTAVRHTVTVTNTSGGARDFGLRFLWDWKVASVDSAWFRTRDPDGGFTQTFTTFANPAFLHYQESDSDTMPLFSIYGSVGEPNLLVAPTPPDELRFAAWTNAKDAAWDFTNSGAGIDSAIVYYWGKNSSINLGSGASASFTQYVTTKIDALRRPLPSVHKRESSTWWVCGGERLTYTVSWSNRGDGTSYDLTITDTVSALVTYEPGSLSWYAMPDGGAPLISVSPYYATGYDGPWAFGQPPGGYGSPFALRWVVSRVSPAKSGALTYRVRLADDVATDWWVNNFVTATNYLDETVFTSTLTANRCERPVVQKFASPGEVLWGGAVRYTILVGNICRENLQNVVVVDSVPGGTTFSMVEDFGQVLNDYTLVKWNVGTISPGASAYVHYVVTATGGSVFIDNQACAGYLSGSGTRPPPGCASAQVETEEPRVYFRKLALPARTPRVGRLTYVIDVINVTNATITNVVVWDSLPSDVSFVACTGGCAEAGGFLVWNDPFTVWPHPGDGSYSSRQLYVTVDVNASCSATTLLPNFADMDYAPDPLLAPPPVRSEASDVPLEDPLVAFYGAADPGSVPEGGHFRYVFSIQNKGSASAFNVTFWDTVPDEVDFVDASGAWSKTTGDTGKDIIVWDVPTLKPLEWGTPLAMTVQINQPIETCFGPHAGLGRYQSSAACAPAYNAGTPAQVCVTQPQLTATAYATALKLPQGSSLTYVFSVTNTGGDTAVNVSIWDTLPAGITYQSCAGPPGSSCSYSAGDHRVDWMIPGIDPAVNKNAVVTVTGIVSGAGPTICTNPAEVAYTNRIAVPRPRVATNGVCVEVRQPLVRLFKQAQYDPVGEDGPEVFRIAVTNLGEVAATSVKVWDTLPAGAPYVSCGVPAGSTCWFDGQMVIWQVPAVAGESEVLLDVTVTATGAMGCTNYAAGFYYNEVPLPMTATVSNGSCVAVVQALMELEMTTAGTIYVSGEPVTYFIRYSNTGTGEAQKVTLWDSLPLGSAFVGLTGPGNTAGGGALVYWTIGSVPGGASGVVSFTAILPVAACLTATVWNAATLDYSNVSSVHRPWVSASRSVLVNGALLVLSATPSGWVLPQGSELTYTIGYSNPCTDTVWNVVLWQPLDPDVDFVACAAAPGGTCGENAASRRVTWSIPAVPPGAAGEVSFTVFIRGEGPLIGPDRVTASFTNSAGVPHAATDGAAVAITVIAPGLGLNKDGPAWTETHTPFAFTLSVTNTGTAPAYNVLVVDTLPSPLRFVSATGSPVVAGNVVSWTIPELAPGAGAEFTITAVGPNEDLDLEVTNRATVVCWTRTYGGIERPAIADSASVRMKPALVLRVFPNPYRPASAVRGTMKFSGLPAGSLVRIFTLSGVEVRRLAGPVNHRLEWDGRNENGTPVAGGIYLYAIEIPDEKGGKEYVKGKFGLVR